MIISSQVRSARSALGWSASQLGVEAGLSLKTIQTAEADDGENQIRKSSLLATQAALESAGIEFIGTPYDGPGIRIHKSTQSK